MKTSNYWVNNIAFSNQFGGAHCVLWNPNRRCNIAGFRIKETHYNRDIRQAANNVIKEMDNIFTTEESRAFLASLGIIYKPR